MKHNEVDEGLKTSDVRNALIVQIGKIGICRGPQVERTNMVGTSRAVTNDSIDGESKDVYRHEEA